MSETELDVERVKAVHAALAGPQKVWVVWWQCEDSPNFGCWLCSSRDAALRSLRLALTDKSDDMIQCGYFEDEDEAQKAIDDCILSVTAGVKAGIDGTDYWIEEKTISE